MAYPSKAYIVSRPELRAKGTEEGLILAYDIGKPVDGRMPDYSPTGAMGTVYDGPSVEMTPIGPAMRFTGTNLVGQRIDTNSANLGLTIADNLSGMFWMKTDYNFAADIGMIINDYNVVTPAGWSIRVDATNVIRVENYQSVGNTRSRLSDAVANHGRWLHVAFNIYADGSLPDLYINGIAQVTSSTFGVVNQLNLGNTNVMIGRQSNTAARWYNGLLGPIELYKNKIITDQQARNAYLKGKTALWRTEYGPAVSSSDEGGVIGNYLSQTPFQFGDTTVRARVEVDSINGVSCKVITCKTAGLLYCPTSVFQQNSTEAAFGTWEWWWYKGADANAPLIMICASIIAGISGAQNGYCIGVNSSEQLYIARITAGVAAFTNMFSAPAYFTNVAWHRMVASRSTTGVFTMYHDENLMPITGGGGANPSAADVTHTASSWFVLDLDANDKIGYSCLSGGRAIIKRVIAT